VSLRFFLYASLFFKIFFSGFDSLIRGGVKGCGEIELGFVLATTALGFEWIKDASTRKL